MSIESETEKLKQQNKAKKNLQKQQRVADGLERDKRRRERRSNRQDVVDYARSRGVYVIALNSKPECEACKNGQKCQSCKKTSKKKSAPKQTAKKTPKQTPKKNLDAKWLIAEPVITYVDGNKATTLYNIKGVR